MPVTEIGDPRLQALFGTDGTDSGVRPSVRLQRKDLSSTALAVGAVMLALLLFAVLNARRTSEVEPSESVPRAGVPVQFEAPPQLYIPPAPAPAPVPASGIEPKQALPPAPATTAAPRVVQPQVVYAPQPMPQQFPQLVPSPAPAPAPRTSAGSPLVIDSGNGVSAAASATAVSPVGVPGQVTSRMRASAFANRSLTVPQGALIPAVLETGFNSTKPGFARAVVSRDVRGFDGRKVLIPRGSRLIGEYSSDVGQGQKRVAIIWKRLLRPDGLTIGLESPVVDTLGRGGVAASVNTHFFQRLGDALLQSTFEIGRVVAGRAISDPVVVVSANSATATAGQSVTATNYVPTLTVPAGKSISVFAAHDLDFSAAGGVK